MKRYSIFIIVLILSLSRSDPQPDLVVELCRHGARSPLSDQYDKSWEKDLIGDLTSQGMRQHYLLGSALKKIYPNLLSAPFSKENFYITSHGASNRTIQSVISQMYGITMDQGSSFDPNYPAELAIPPYNSEYVQQILANLTNKNVLPNEYFPTETFYTPIGDPQLIFTSDDEKHCPILKKLASEVYWDKKSMAAWNTFKDVIDNLNKYVKIENPGDLMEYGDTFLCDLTDNRTLPGNIPHDKDLMTNITFAFSWFIIHNWDGLLEQRQLTSWGPINAFLNFTKGFVDGTSNVTYAIFGGHDDNIVALNSALNFVSEDCVMENFISYWKDGSIPQPQCHFPFFASTSIVELYDTKNSPYVKFKYNGDYVKFCKGQFECPFADFEFMLRNATNNNTMADYYSQCQASSSFDINSNLKLYSVTQAIQSINLQSMIITSLTILCGLLSFKLFHQKTKQRLELEELQNQKVF